jgi:hypothetical protein
MPLIGMPLNWDAATAMKVIREGHLERRLEGSVCITEGISIPHICKVLETDPIYARDPLKRRKVKEI